MNREAIEVARCTVVRLMRNLGLQGVRRGKHVRKTWPDPKAPCPLDRVNRQFKASRPNELWVSDFRYVSWRSKFVLFAEFARTTKSDTARQLNLMLGPGHSGQLVTLRRFARHSHVAGRRPIIRDPRQNGLGPGPDAPGRCCGTSKAGRGQLLWPMEN